MVPKTCIAIYNEYFTYAFIAEISNSLSIAHNTEKYNKKKVKKITTLLGIEWGHN